jgi:hypothetical protein
MPNFIASMNGSHIGKFFDFPYWAVKLREPEQWLSEVDNKQFELSSLVPFMNRQRKNTFDWTLDLITTGDILRIEELWLFCPRTPLAPQGSTGVLRFTKDDAGTAFHFNITNMTQFERADHKIIGKVINREDGTCICYVWDDFEKKMTNPHLTNVNNFQSWTARVAGPGMLHKEVIGLRL